MYNVVSTCTVNLHGVAGDVSPICNSLSIGTKKKTWNFPTLQMKNYLRVLKRAHRLLKFVQKYIKKLWSWVCCDLWCITMNSVRLNSVFICFQYFWPQSNDKIWILSTFSNLVWTMQYAMMYCLHVCPRAILFRKFESKWSDWARDKCSIRIS